MRIVLAMWWLWAAGLSAAEFRIGAVREELAPGGPEGPPAYGRAIVFDDGRDGKLLLLEADGVGPSELIAAKVLREYGLERSQLLLTGRTGGQKLGAAAVADRLVQLAGAALGSTKAARLDFDGSALRAGNAMLLFGAQPAGAAAVLEAAQAGLVAIPLSLCGPAPRSVGKAVEGRLQTAFSTTDLSFRPFTRSQLPAELQQEYDDGRLPRKIVYPVQAVRFGREFTLIALAGTVDPAVAVKASQTIAKTALVVIDASNGPEYAVPGNEQRGLTTGQPALFNHDTEELLLEAITQVTKRLK